MKSCPECLASLQTEEVGEAALSLLRSVRHMMRPARFPRFRAGARCTLTRVSAQGSLAIIGQDAFVECYVDTRDNLAVTPMRAIDVDGTLLFTVRDYQASANGLVITDANETPVASYHLRSFGLTAEIDIRDETSAPVARLQSSATLEWDYDLIETGGKLLAAISRRESTTDELTDDSWTLRQISDTLPLKLYGAIGITLAAKLMLGQVRPYATGSETKDSD